VLWWQIPVAILIAVVIWRVGAGMVRAFSRPAPGSEHPDPEDVEELDVFLICRECGTEYQVTRLGEMQIPRHCGEPMAVVRRPAGATGGP
jgi:hypothetical protein